MQASLDQAGILLANPSISLQFAQVNADETQTTLADSKGQVKLLFGHCDPSLLKKRPELLLLLAKQVLPEAYKSLAN
ncbi:MAG: hypothetical protein JRF33_25925 [Deltaproteobacteria bacterium]|nr:hypothetical protein [Deltaproteobacteria bacterium]